MDKPNYHKPRDPEIMIALTVKGAVIRAKGRLPVVLVVATALIVMVVWRLGAVI